MGGEAIVAGAEVVKLLLILAFQTARRAKMAPEELDKLYTDTRVKFLASEPEAIPEL